VEVIRDYQPPSATNQKFESSSTGVTDSVTPERKGEEGRFDLVNPPNGSTQKKITVWIRFEQPDAEQ
jgi:hypothetical protein